MYRCDHRPKFLSFFLFLYSFLIFSFCYSLLILLSFLNFFLLIYSYSCLLILLILLVLFFVFLFSFSYILICLLYYGHKNYVPVRPYVLTFLFYPFSLFFKLKFLLFSSYSSLHIPSYSSLLIFKLFDILQTCILNTHWAKVHK